MTTLIPLILSITWKNPPKTNKNMHIIITVIPSELANISNGAVNNLYIGKLFTSRYLNESAIILLFISRKYSPWGIIYVSIKAATIKVVKIINTLKKLFLLMLIKFLFSFMFIPLLLIIMISYSNQKLYKQEKSS